MGMMSTDNEKPPRPRKPAVPLQRAKSTNSVPGRLQPLSLRSSPQSPPRHGGPRVPTAGAGGGGPGRSRYGSAHSGLVDGMRRLRIHSNSPALKRGHSSAAFAPPHLPTAPSSGYTSKKRSIEDVADMIAKSRVKNIVVLAGAGISTPSGIPDFRSPGTGLYDNLQQYKIPYPQAVFDMDYFLLNPRPFYTLAREIYPSGKYQPNYAHYFLRLLHEKNLLLRVYTQNIDGLEKLAGLPSDKVIEAHGTFSTTSCVRCRTPQDPEDVKDAIFNNKIPRCSRLGCGALVKPDIVFFGEDLPRRFYYHLRDLPMADLLLVMGTSLEVEPFAGIVDSCRVHVPRVLFNRDAVGPFKARPRMNDVIIKGEIVSLLRGFVNLLGWKTDMTTLLKQYNFTNMLRRRVVALLWMFALGIAFFIPLLQGLCSSGGGLN